MLPCHNNGTLVFNLLLHIVFCIFRGLESIKIIANFFLTCVADVLRYVARGYTKHKIVVTRLF